jgi:hypothetical protein
MKIKSAARMLLGSAFLLAAGSAWAHHSMITEYTITQPIVLRGAITKMEWKNPHGWIYVDVRDAEGKVENWAVETGSPYNMERRGLTRAAFRSGTEVIIGAFAARNGTRSAAGWVVTFPSREVASDEGAEVASFSLGR